MKLCVQIDDLEVRPDETEGDAVKRAIAERQLTLREISEQKDREESDVAN